MKKQRKAPASQLKPEPLYIRLLPDINDSLRSRIRYRGELSQLVEEAIMAVPALADLELVSMDKVSNVERNTTANLSVKCRKLLKASAIKRGVSMNVLTNSAVKWWLQNKKGE